MKSLLSTCLIALSLSACHNNTALSEKPKISEQGIHYSDTHIGDYKKHSANNGDAMIIDQNHQTRKKPIPPTAYELLHELKLGHQWQSLPFNGSNVEDNWQLLVVSDNDFNELNLPIIKKNKFTITVEKSLSSDYYWIYMPNNCNSMSGKVQLTKTGIKSIGGLFTTEILCGKLPKELDDHIIHTAIFNGHYEILEKGKQRILKIMHNQQNWFFYSYDPMTSYGLIKSFKKDRDDFNLVSFDVAKLVNDWRLYAISDKHYNPAELILWQKNGRERYQLTFKTDHDNKLWLSMPNYCNQIRIPFKTTDTGIIPNFNQLMTSNIKCDIAEYYKEAKESIIHDAVYYGKYQLFQNADGTLLKISYNNQILFFISEFYNDKQQNYLESNHKR